MPHSGPVTAETLVVLLRDCADQLDSICSQLRPLRSKQNLNHRLFRLRWELFAKRRTGKPLPGVGTILFNVTFGTAIDCESYSRMLRRDRETLAVAKKARTKTAAKSR